MLHVRSFLTVFTAIGVATLTMSSPTLATPCAPGYDLIACAEVGAPGDLCCANFCLTAQNDCFLWCRQQYVGDSYAEQLAEGFCNSTCINAYDECVKEGLSFPHPAMPPPPPPAPPAPCTPATCTTLGATSPPPSMRCGGDDGCGGFLDCGWCEASGVTSCKDFNTDNANCGRCGHICNGDGPCVGGICYLPRKP